MAVKVSAFHVYTHQDCETDTLEHCHLCEISLETQNSDFEIVANASVQDFVEIPVSNTLNLFVQEIAESTNVYFLFSRPPPFTLA